jgi:site-specific DNA-methyltransferase (adenine-specific)
MQKLPSQSLDLIYFNPPFATTRCWWDQPLDWVIIFKECIRLLKPTGNLVIHCAIPFNYHLIRVAPKPPSYSFYWNKLAQTTPLLCNTQPLRCVEEILVWKMSGKSNFYPQKIGTELKIVKVKNKNSVGNYTNFVKPQENVTYVGKYRTHLIDMKKKIRGFATRPDEMVELILNYYTKPGDTVLDPTCYLGLSGRITKSLGRNWIGIDKYFYPTELLNTN